MTDLETTELKRVLSAYKIALGVCAEDVLALRAEVGTLRDDAERHRRLRAYQRRWAAEHRKPVLNLLSGGSPATPGPTGATVDETPPDGLPASAALLPTQASDSPEKRDG